MEIVRDIPKLKETVKKVRAEGKSIGLVPTMGYLHEGHLSLLQAARSENDFLVMSIFVNPIQFGAGEDYEEYPRDLERDRELSLSDGCDLIFYPEVRDMYPEGYSTFVEVEGLTETLCGASRPGHFRGVTTVVLKLFNLVSPHRAYFGQKDAQQALVLKKMVEDLNVDVDLIIKPTVREPDCLAMSSRNKYLTPEQRKEAPLIYRGLEEARKLFREGERDAEQLKHKVKEIISGSEEALIDYVEIVETRGLQPVKEVRQECLLAAAVKFGSTRLIDNVMLEV